MNQVLQITDPGWDWMPLIISGGVTVAVLLVAGAFWWAAEALYGKRRWGRYTDAWETTAQVLLFIAVVGGILGNGFVAISGQSSYQSRLSDAKVQGLEDLGYANVDLGTSKFTASIDGEYFSGSLVSSGTLKWEVVKLNAE